MSRLDRERKTIETMIDLYCRSHHHSEGLCPECKTLMDYARRRIEKCRFGEKKPVCGRCTVHCYKPGMRSKIKHVMRYSGPRMFFHHPQLAIEHIKDRIRY